MSEQPDTTTQAPTRARLVAALVAATKAGHLRYVGRVSGGGDALAVEIGDRRRVYPPAGMAAWHRGFTAGRHHQPAALAAIPHGPAYAGVVELLTAPDLADQCRIAIRAAQDAAGLTTAELADRSGLTRKTVSDALKFGRPQTLSLTRAQQLMAGTGRTWHVTYVDPEHAGPAAPDLTAPTRREPAALTRLRMLAVAADRGLLRWVDDLDTTKATKAYRLAVRVADEPRPVRLRAADELEPFLLGLADAADPATAADLERLAADVTR
ncbi:winged helix-turn-helix domain-containing protein [Micromonospora haikouensis]|uniref:winged helix-turn-helix domain-containing protein n=1 Tax=Micromonospora haikouensis TaxID=686309 RepID=UPI0033DE5F8B